MTAQQFAALLNARPTGQASRWVARCPAHHDRNPSLSIAEGRGGRVLVKCWAACSLERIAQAAGVSLEELFPVSERDGVRRQRPKPQATKAELYRDLREEANRAAAELLARGISGELLTTELNAVRRRVAIKHDVHFEPLPCSLYEGGYGGRDRDPLWSAIFESSWVSASVMLLGFPLPSLREMQRNRLRPPVMVFIEAEELAAAAMRGMERATRNEVAV